MISILFICHGNTADSQELVVHVGQNGTNHVIDCYLIYDDVHADAHELV